MEKSSLYEELRGNRYPGRGIVLGRSEDGKKAMLAYFIMGRSENSRNRIFSAQRTVYAQRPSIRQNSPIRR